MPPPACSTWSCMAPPVRPAAPGVPGAVMCAAVAQLLQSCLACAVLLLPPAGTRSTHWLCCHSPQLGADSPFTALVPDLSGGVDPDDAFSSIPYEKGFYFLYYLQVGGRDVGVVKSWLLSACCASGFLTVQFCLNTGGTWISQHALPCGLHTTELGQCPAA